MTTDEPNSPLPEENRCPQCGAPLVAAALGGLCPACLLAQGASPETVTGGGPAKRAFVPPSVAELAPLFPQLEILELIGQGGMGAVYKARQRDLDRIVALKILPRAMDDAAGFAERFGREAKALAKLNHPGIVTIHEFGRADGLYYFLMEFIDGVNLRELLVRGRVSPREALAIVPEICDALQYAHDSGIVHRDIKPENILLDRRGRVKIADFGLAKLIAEREIVLAGNPGASEESDLTEAGKSMGTPSYMAPEQSEHPGEVDHRADIYALGVVFYQMLTGELPQDRITPPSRKVVLDVRLDEVVLRTLEKRPELRYQQASHVKADVETIASSADAAPASRAEAHGHEVLARDYSLNIRSCLRRGWALVKSDFWPLVGMTALITVLLGIAGSVGGTVSNAANGSHSSSGTAVLYLLLHGPLVGGLRVYFLHKIRRQRATVETAFSGFSHCFLHLFLAGFVTMTLTTFGFFCLILPGIYLMVAWTFTLALVIDKQLHFWAAMELSRQAVSKHWWKFFGFALVLALLKFVGFIALLIGYFLAAPIALAALMYAYEDIFSSDKTAVKTAPAVEPHKGSRGWIWFTAAAVVLALGISLIVPRRRDDRPANQPVAGFRPVVERVLAGVIDLEKGAVTKPPFAGFANDDSAFAWARQRGGDLMDADNQIKGVDLLLASLDEKDWKTLEVNGLRAKIGAKTLRSGTLRKTGGTYGFRTREGSLGILQITDSNRSSGVKIRYKLAKTSALEPLPWLQGDWVFDAEYFQQKARAGADAATDPNRKAMLEALSTAVFAESEGMSWTITATEMQSNHPQTGSRKGPYRIVEIRDANTAEIEIDDEGTTKRIVFHLEGERLRLTGVTPEVEAVDIPAYYKRAAPASRER